MDSSEHTMSEPQPENKLRSAVKGILGFFLGILISLGCLYVSGVAASPVDLHPRTFPLLNAIALAVVGILVLRKMRESGYGQGILIAMSVAFLVNAALVVLFWGGVRE
jgi:hypothetical protein